MNAAGIGIGATLLGALVYTVTNLVPRVRVRDWNAVVKQLLAWAVGVGAVALVDASNLADGVIVYGRALGSFNVASIVIAGLLIASPPGVVYDALKGRANVPALIRKSRS